MRGLGRQQNLVKSCGEPHDNNKGSETMGAFTTKDGTEIFY